MHYTKIIKKNKKKLIKKICMVKRGTCLLQFRFNHPEKEAKYSKIFNDMMVSAKITK